MAPLSFIWFYGNLSAYTDSYFRFLCYPKCLDCDPQWLMSLVVAGNFPGAFMVKQIKNIVGLWWTGIIGMVMVNVALLGSAWTLHLSAAWTAVVYGILLAPGAGMTASVSIQVINGWEPQKAAILMATSTGAATMLSVLQNQIITDFVNPRNLKPDALIRSEEYFSQPEILNRVPRVVIILGAITLGFQTAGYLLIWNPPNSAPDFPNKAQIGEVVPANSIGTSKKTRGISLEYVSSLDNVKTNQDGKNYGLSVQSCERIHLVETSQREQINVSSNHAGKNPTDKITDEKETKIVRTDNLRSYTPKEVLRSPVFYAVFFFGMALEYGLLLKANFYKKFALLYIRNDKYLTLVGTLIPIISTCSRILFGILIDKSIINFKDVIVFGLSLNCVISAYWYISAQVNEILYMFILLGLTIAHSLYYIVIPTGPLRIFGPVHISTNYALVSSCTFVASMLSPVINTPILKNLGWQWVFTSSSIFSLFVLFYVRFTKFNTQDWGDNE
ncbi:oxalate:formate antiporter-like isoform x1 [Plakobranchus ocellatus]|uniref:Oxalate:formate antiporter-like isoform x1 n=1 Tax=Plakobranchus ocellatus TaxID=259542 RepID=A0AAV4CYN4_9GAST|nr:oxalate:formate antiporter-like isoform x1 [Plakobranchus ocellatus]